MSPSEADLRAALRAGEGGDLDIERIVAGGRAVKAQRRVRMLTTAAVTVVVAGVGAGAVVLAQSSGSGGSGSRADGRTSGKFGSLSGTAPAVPGPSATSGIGGHMAPGLPLPSPSGLTHDAARTARSAACPASLPDYQLPGGGSPGQFGADGPLFSRAVSSIVVCAYGTATSARTAPRSVVLTGGAARTVAASLENAPRVKATGACPFYRTADAQTLAIVGFASDGAPVGVVTAAVGVPACSVQVTNGTALRYQWLPPAALRTALGRLDPVAGRSHGPVMRGSPVSS